MDEELFKSAKLMKMRDKFREAASPQPSNTDNGQHSLRNDKIENTRANLVEHLERHKPAWYGRETAKVLQEQKGKLKPTLTPKWIVDTQTSPGTLARQALHNVDQRCEQRLNRFEEIALRARERMQQSAKINVDQQPRNRME